MFRRGDFKIDGAVVIGDGGSLSGTQRARIFRGFLEALYSNLFLM